MYADYFGLKHLPFNNTPDPRFFFSTPDHEEALASLIYAVQEAKGCVLLTGEVGTGKTLVSRMMLRHFGDRISFANITHSTRSALDLMESVCAEFNLAPPSGAGNAALVRLLHDHLLAEFANNRPVVLVLDEAQNLSIDAFEQLRMIGNLESDDAKLLQIVILGQPELQRLIHSAQLRQLHQRIFRSFHLTALSRSMTAEYIRHRLTVAGASDNEIFDEDAIHALHAFSRGLPRLINTACDNAMLAAYSANRGRIDGPFVAEVVDQLTRENAAADSQPGAVPRTTGMVDAGECGWGDAAGGPQEPGEQRRGEYEEPLPRRPARRGEARRPGRSPQPSPDDRGVSVTSVSLMMAELRGSSTELIERTDLLAGRVETLERRLERDRGGSSSATRALIDELNAAAAAARDVLSGERRAAENAEVSRRQAQKLTQIVRTVLEQTKALVTRLNETTAKADRAEHNARRTCERLTAQAERTGRLSALVRDVFRRIEQLQAMATSSPAAGRMAPAGRMASAGQVTGAGPAMGANRVTVAGEATGAGRVTEARQADRRQVSTDQDYLLDTSRAALSELRLLLQETEASLSETTETPAATRHDQPEHAAPSTDDENRAGDEYNESARLAHHVQELVAMIESAERSPIALAEPRP